MLDQTLKNLAANPIIQKYQLLILPAVAIVISLVLILLVDVPQVIQILNDEKVLAQTALDYENLQNKLSTLQQIDDASYKGQIDTALTAIPVERDVPGALGQVLFLISNSNLRLDGIALTNISEVGSTGATSSNNSFQIRVEVTGTVDSLKRFTEKVRETPRVMKITGLELSEARGTNQLQATISLTAYYQPLPTALGEVGKDISPLSAQEESIIKKIESFSRNTPTSSGSGSVIVGKSNPFE